MSNKVNNILHNSHVICKLILNSDSVQVYNESKQLEFKKFNFGDNNADNITDYDRFESADIDNCISYIKENKNKFDDYLYMKYDCMHNKIFLSFAITNENKFIDDYDGVSKLTESLGLEMVPIVWEGSISDNQFNNIYEMMEGKFTNEEFVDMIYETFGNYVEYPVEFFEKYSSDVIGFTLFFTLDKDGQVYETNVFNKSYLDRLKNIISEEKNNLGDESICKIMKDWISKNKKEYKDITVMESIQNNFCRMMSDSKIYNRLFYLAANLKINLNEMKPLNDAMLTEEMRSSLNKFGSIYRLLLEKFIRLC